MFPKAFRAAVLLAAIFLLACTPTMNWRDVRPSSTRLQALMPCKPDEAVRTVMLDGQTVQMHLAGCDAGGATFVIGWVTTRADRLGAMLGAWQDSTLSLAGIGSGPDTPTGQPFAPAGTRALPQAVRLQGTGRMADGSALALDAAWFADGGGVGALEGQALFAAIYRSASAPDAAATFFSGLRLR
ncbi:hypothetical protein GN316_09655 [Xylophilus sp. Kf1]|nr:hypothetical protein [Xylophilus sp. Kf1]